MIEGTRQPTAALIVIASEVLSGRTTDSHIARLAHWSGEQSVALRFACVVPDERQAVIDAINLCRTGFDHVFTAGGLGSTHDDMTVSAVADALGLPMERNPEAEAALREHYGERLRDAHLKLADLPRGAQLIIPPERGIGVIRVENIVLLAGIPDIADAMLEVLCDHVAAGPVVHQRTVGTSLEEESFAAELHDLQASLSECAIASYPLWRGRRAGTNLVVRCTDEALLALCCARLSAILSNLGGTVVEGGIDRSG